MKRLFVEEISGFEYQFAHNQQPCLVFCDKASAEADAAFACLFECAVSFASPGDRADEVVTQAVHGGIGGRADQCAVPALDHAIVTQDVNRRLVIVGFLAVRAVVNMARSRACRGSSAGFWRCSGTCGSRGQEPGLPSSSNDTTRSPTRISSIGVFHIFACTSSWSQMPSGPGLRSGSSGHMSMGTSGPKQSSLSKPVDPSLIGSSEYPNRSGSVANFSAGRNAS